MDQHEKLRLLYVATTRARDHLVVSAHHNAPTDAPPTPARSGRTSPTNPTCGDARRRPSHVSSARPTVASSGAARPRRWSGRATHGWPSARGDAGAAAGATGHVGHRDRAARSRRTSPTRTTTVPTSSTTQPSRAPRRGEPAPPSAAPCTPRSSCSTSPHPPISTLRRHAGRRRGDTRHAPTGRGAWCARRSRRRRSAWRRAPAPQGAVRRGARGRPGDRGLCRPARRDTRRRSDRRRLQDRHRRSEAEVDAKLAAYELQGASVRGRARRRHRSARRRVPVRVLSPERCHRTCGRRSAGGQGGACSKRSRRRPTKRRLRPRSSAG